MGPGIDDVTYTRRRESIEGITKHQKHEIPTDVEITYSYQNHDRKSAS